MAIEISDSARADLIFSFETPFAPVVFDDEATHGMYDRMKKVDFVVNSPDQTWLIEVKDPENRRIPPARATAERAGFRRKMRLGTLYGRELAPKFKDTLIYLTLANRAPANRIRYIVVLGIARLDAAMLLTAQNKLRRLCYVPGPFQSDWSSSFDVLVFNIAAWNAKLAPHSVRRRR